MNLLKTNFSKSYLARCHDEALPIRVTFETLCDFAEQEDAHFHSIEILFSLRCRDRGRDEQ